jgi:hypothetical protein
MSSHDHDSNLAPGARPTDLDTAIQRAAAAMRQAPVANQTGRSSDPRQGHGRQFRTPAPQATLSCGVAATRAADDGRPARATASASAIISPAAARGKQ